MPSTPSINLLSRPQLEAINRQGLRYPLGFAEKDYFLAIALQILYTSSLRDILVFKGGTALYHTFLPQMRFSEDLDFTALKAVSLVELRDVFAPYRFLTIKKDYRSEATVKIERLGYEGPLGQPNALKVEIDFTQNVVLPAKREKYQNYYGIETEVAVMDLREIVAEKIRAVGQRAKYRDFYDLAAIEKHGGINLVASLNLLKQKEMRSPFTPESIRANWEVAQQEKSNRSDTIYYSEDIARSQIETVINQITALLAK